MTHRGHHQVGEFDGGHIIGRTASFGGKGALLGKKFKVNLLV